MDDYFSGLIRPHLDEMKLEEEDWESDNSRNRDKSVDPSIDDEPQESSTNSRSFEADQGNPLPVDGSSLSDSSDKATKNGSSTSSSSSSEDRVKTTDEPSTLDEFRFPMINYERDYTEQTLVGIIGREFDEPWVIASSLQALAKGAAIDGEPSQHPKIKFVPYTVRRSILIKGNLDPNDIARHDVICMCYNASETRILLTGTDGYYTQLLRHVEALLGSNRGAFLITHYTAPGKEIEESTHNELISPVLKERLQVQNELSIYFENDQVMSWYNQPQKCHVIKLQSLAKLEANASGYMHCILL